MAKDLQAVAKMNQDGPFAGLKIDAVFLPTIDVEFAGWNGEITIAPPEKGMPAWRIKQENNEGAIHYYANLPIVIKCFPKEVEETIPEEE